MKRNHMIAVIAAVGVAVLVYFGSTKLLVGHHYPTKYEKGDCLQVATTKTVFLIQGNAKDSYLCEIKNSGNTVPGSFQVGSSFALSIEVTDKSPDYSKVSCPD